MNTESLTRIVPAVGLVICVAAEVLMGPLLLDRIVYRVSSDANAQYIGGELVTLAASLVVLWGALTRPGVRGTIFCAGAAIYIIYTMLTVIFGQDYTRYEGNADRWFALFVVITTSALFSAAQFVARIFRMGVLSPHRPARITVFVASALFAIFWISAIMAQYRQPSPEYLADPTLFWLIKYLDLAAVIPTGLLAALIWTGNFRTTGMLVLGFSTWMLAAIAGMQIGMIVLAGAPAATLLLVALMAAGSLWSARVIATLP